MPPRRFGFTGRFAISSSAAFASPRVPPARPRPRRPPVSLAIALRLSADPPRRRIDAQDFHVNRLPFARPRRERARTALSRKLGNVDEPLDAGFQFHERPEIGDARHLAGQPRRRL